MNLAQGSGAVPVLGALSVLYGTSRDEEGFRFNNHHLLLVLVDTTELACAPKRILVCGLGDAPSTRFEARTVRESCKPTMVGGLPSTSGAWRAAAHHRPRVMGAAHLLLQPGVVAIGAWRQHRIGQGLAAGVLKPGGVAMAEARRRQGHQLRLRRPAPPSRSFATRGRGSHLRPGWWCEEQGKTVGEIAGVLHQRCQSVTKCRSWRLSNLSIEPGQPQEGCFAARLLPPLCKGGLAASSP